MNAIDFLREDHVMVLDMLDRLERGPSISTNATEEQLRARAELVTQLVIAESQHEAVEEQHFWPVVRDRVPNGERLAGHAVEEEQAAKQVLNKLEHGSVDDPEIELLIDKIIVDGREHIAYEQDKVWPEVRNALSAADLDELGQRLAEAKKSAPTRPHPHTPGSPAVQKTVGPAAAMVDRARDKATGRDAARPE